MDCGDAGHILLSKRVAEDLEQYGHWRPHLHDLGECEVKHGVRIHVVNLHTDELGNPAAPRKFDDLNKTEKAGTHRGWLIGAAALLIGLFAVATFWSWNRQAPHRAEPGLAKPFLMAPEKSIAVLPFQNLSTDQENAFFADGVQDEILTDLAKIADLKVISRTSVMQYKTGAPRNLREIGEQLGVAHVLEGSVQRAEGKVRVIAQLIDTRTDAHIWANTYDRNLADVFAIQSEIAKTIADQLRARLSPSEKAAIEQPPTNDLAAFDLYTRAKTMLLGITFNALVKANLAQGAELLDQAVARDPNFFLAYCQLAYAHGIAYFVTDDHTPARRALADAAVQNVVRLRPDAGETHLVEAEYYYRCYRDYDRARSELELARRGLQNNPKVFELTGYIDRRQGRWDESARNLEKALELDPRNFFILQQISLSYHYLRRYNDMAAALDRALALVPGDIDCRVTRAYVDLEERANPKPLYETIRAIVNQDPKAAEGLADQWLYLALCEHDASEAQRALAAIPPNGITAEGVNFSRVWCEAAAARAAGEMVTQHDLFLRAKAEQERTVREQPDNGPPLCVLGMIDAALGRKNEAIAEGRRAIELLPVSKDSATGAKLLEYLAVIYAWCGEKDLALDQLKLTLRYPGDLSYGNLRLHPNWDALRGDPRFEQLVASLASK
jgi:TolB-like protein/Flp pilus assembly protein TadD